MIANLSNTVGLCSLLWVSSPHFIKRVNIQSPNSLETSPSTVQTWSFVWLELEGVYACFTFCLCYVDQTECRLLKAPRQRLDESLQALNPND